MALGLVYKILTHLIYTTSSEWMIFRPRLLEKSLRVLKELLFLEKECMKKDENSIFQKLGKCRILEENIL